MQNLQQSPNQNADNQGNAVNSQISPNPPYVQPSVRQNEKVYALISYLPLVAFLSLILKPESAFVRLHARQGLLLFLIFFFAGIFAAIFSTFGLIGGIIAFFMAFIPLAIFIIALYSMYMAITGIWWKIPVIGAVSELIPIELFAKVAQENITTPLQQAKDDYLNSQNNAQPNVTNDNAANNSTDNNSVNNTPSNPTN